LKCANGGVKSEKSFKADGGKGSKTDELRHQKEKEEEKEDPSLINLVT